MIRIFLISLLLLITNLAAGQVSDTLRVLFVGNSYTYFWNLPQTVEAMAVSADFPLIARKSTAGGTNWRQHWEGEKGLKSRQLIEQGNWDVVVLQNHSRSTLDSLDQFMEYGEKFINLVKSTGARPVLYETWAREHNPLTQKDINEGYHALAQKHNIEVVHIGELWHYALQQRPGLRLYDPDQSHPSTIGTYLTASAFFTYFTGKRADGLPKRVSTTDRDGELLYLSIMSEEDAEYLQMVVDTMRKEENE